MSKLMIAIILSLLLGTCGCTPAPNSTPESEAPTAPIEYVGGFEDAREPTEDELALFESTTRDTEYANYTPLTVSTQVVAGMKYRFYCMAKPDSSEGEYVIITIYAPVDDEAPSILSVEPANAVQ